MSAIPPNDRTRRTVASNHPDLDHDGSLAFRGTDEIEGRCLTCGARRGRLDIARKTVRCDDCKRLWPEVSWRGG